MEYLRVIFAEQRRVIIDNVDTGQEIGKVIKIEAGKHIISLTGPPDFEPPKKEVTLENTSVLDPLELDFKKKKVHGG